MERPPAISSTREKSPVDISILEDALRAVVGHCGSIIHDGLKHEVETHPRAKVGVLQAANAVVVRCERGGISARVVRSSRIEVRPNEAAAGAKLQITIACDAVPPNLHGSEDVILWGARWECCSGGYVTVGEERQARTTDEIAVRRRRRRDGQIFARQVVGRRSLDAWAILEGNDTTRRRIGSA